MTENLFLELAGPRQATKKENSYSFYKIDSYKYIPE